MKTLKNHLILFDAECPMCEFYTQAFVKNGMLEPQGRTAYQQIPEQVCPMVDQQRAANEIALINTETGEVTYGIKSLFKILSTAWPILQPLFLFGPFVWLMSKVYAFIAYNRRVIVPDTNLDNSFTFQPTLRLDYRIAYLVFIWAITSYILSNYVHLMNGLLSQGHAYREYFICGGQIIFQGLIVSMTNQKKSWTYLGNMMTISFAGAILLLPGLVLSIWFNLHSLFYAVYFMIVAGLMLLEHIRRTKLLKLGYTLTISWVLYRISILLLILLTN